MFVTGGPGMRGGSGMPQRIVAISVPHRCYGSQAPEVREYARHLRPFAIASEPMQTAPTGATSRGSCCTSTPSGSPIGRAAWVRNNHRTRQMDDGGRGGKPLQPNLN
jgi:hypothetical protein